MDLREVGRLARMDEEELAALVERLEYYPAEAPTRSPTPRDFLILDIAINLRATMLAGGPVSAEPPWMELANRPELNEPAQIVREISASNACLGVRVRR